MEIRIEILDELSEDGRRDGARSEYRGGFVSVMVFDRSHVGDRVRGDGR